MSVGDKGAAKAALYKWHGNLCHICYMPMRMQGTGPKGEQFQASVDHLTPKSQGGTREAHNILLAHRLCNHVRGNQPLNDELRDECSKRILMLLDSSKEK